jgi:hypothetical protein
MYQVQSGRDLDLLFAGDNRELLLKMNWFVEKINFSITSDTPQLSKTFLFATGYIISNRQYIHYDTSSIVAIISPLTTFELDVKVKINIGNQVFVGYNTGLYNPKRFTIVGANTYF